MDSEQRYAIRSQLAFVDIETTGLDPNRHQIWEICIATFPSSGEADDEIDTGEGFWRLSTFQVEHSLKDADPKALDIGQYWDRWRKGKMSPYYPISAAQQVMRSTWGKHIAGVNPSFDIAFLTALLRKQELAAGWNYHSLDVTTLAMGFLHGRGGYGVLDPVELTVPWSSMAISEQMGVERIDEHTAAGDVAWAIAQFEQVLTA